MRLSIYIWLFGAIALGGCSSLVLPPIGVSRIGSVVGDLKRQVAIYQAIAEERHSHPDKDPAKKNADFKCGRGDIDFDIDAVELDLLSTYDGTDAISLSATGPIGGGTVSGGLSSSINNNNTQELKFNLYPLHRYKGPSLEHTGPAPISDVLLALRTALITSSTMPGICVYDYDFRAGEKSIIGKDGTNGSPSGNTFKFSVTVTNDNKLSLGAGFSFANLLLSREIKTVEGNTLTVTFKQRGVVKAVVLDDRQDPVPVKGGQRGQGALPPIGLFKTIPKENIFRGKGFQAF